MRPHKQTSGRCGCGATRISPLLPLAQHQAAGAPPQTPRSCSYRTATVPTFHRLAWCGLMKWHGALRWRCVTASDWERHIKSVWKAAECTVFSIDPFHSTMISSGKIFRAWRFWHLTSHPPWRQCKYPRMHGVLNQMFPIHSSQLGTG